MRWAGTASSVVVVTERNRSTAPFAPEDRGRHLGRDHRPAPVEVGGDQVLGGGRRQWPAGETAASVTVDGLATGAGQLPPLGVGADDDEALLADHRQRGGRRSGALGRRGACQPGLDGGGIGERHSERADRRDQGQVDRAARGGPRSAGPTRRPRRCGHRRRARPAPTGRSVSARSSSVGPTKSDAVYPRRAASPIDTSTGPERVPLLVGVPQQDAALAEGAEQGVRGRLVQLAAARDLGQREPLVGVCGEQLEHGHRSLGAGGGTCHAVSPPRRCRVGALRGGARSRVSAVRAFVVIVRLESACARSAQLRAAPPERGVVPVHRPAYCARSRSTRPRISGSRPGGAASLRSGAPRSPRPRSPRLAAGPTRAGATQRRGRGRRRRDHGGRHPHDARPVRAVRRGGRGDRPADPARGADRQQRRTGGRHRPAQARRRLRQPAGQRPPRPAAQRRQLAGPLSRRRRPLRRRRHPAGEPRRRERRPAHRRR